VMFQYGCRSPDRMLGDEAWSSRKAMKIGMDPVEIRRRNLIADDGLSQHFAIRLAV